MAAAASRLGHRQAASQETMHEAMAVGAEALQIVELRRMVCWHVGDLNTRVVNLDAGVTVFRSVGCYRIGAAALAEQAAVPLDEGNRPVKSS